MGIFRKGETLGSARGESRLTDEPRYKIRITTDDGRELFWHKRGRLHVVDEDVARAFVANFKPELFQVTEEGSFEPPAPGRTTPVVKVEMEPVE